ncbi:oligoribonuclease [Lysinibacillus sp. CNPSo 3705]|uniref:oligoribonuclease n=1 Tax=Lysinibacillus sp. CNPSo 3705 TaxID=3028148 RepID=UPI00236408AB|nr:oligoribonuclease [Lysinibacillus sp. CNPSo 3705]MDD1504253.1 oligoribonuclease [Lysinibacillus sp. CNPSo 3705]
MTTRTKKVLEQQEISEQQEVPETSEQQEVSEQNYSRDEILVASSVFKVSAEFLAGALTLVEGDKLTRTQVEAAIKKFKGQKV